MSFPKPGIILRLLDVMSSYPTHNVVYECLHISNGNKDSKINLHRRNSSSGLITQMIDDRNQELESNENEISDLLFTCS